MFPIPKSFLSLFVAILLVMPAAAQQELDTELIAQPSGIPHLITHVAGDSHRLFVVDLYGVISIIRDGVLQPTPFLDLSGQLNTFQSSGLLGMAFHPDYLQNGWVFLLYSNLNGDTELTRYQVNPNNPDELLPNSKQLLLTAAQPFPSHNGGNLAFGPDGYLYVGLGDGGNQGVGDPGNRAQNPSTWLGKMLRLDVNQLPYRIPTDNLGVLVPAMLDEIWAVGFRNPWRYSFDRLTQDLWITDVGQALYEEIDLVPAGPTNPADLNFGWRLKEGFHCFNPSSNCDPNQVLRDPTWEYDHSAGRCAIIGGFVYRGRAMAELQGDYLYGDYCTGEVLSLHWDSANQLWVERSHGLETGYFGAITGFGEDNDGEIYAATSSGIFRIVPKGFRLSVEGFTAGQQATMEIQDAMPNATVIFAFSRSGLGSRSFPPFGLEFDLHGAIPFASSMTDANGIATLAGVVPAALLGHTIWLQAAQAGGTNTNVLVDAVE